MKMRKLNEISKNCKVCNRKDKVFKKSNEEGIQLDDCAFKNRVITYRVSSSKTHSDLNEFFNDVKAKTKRLMETGIEKHGSIKLNITLFALYILQT